MAMIKCPECGKEVRDDMVCPECGYPIPVSLNNGDATIGKGRTSSKKKFLDELIGIKWVLRFLAVCCFCASVWFFYKGYDVKNEYFNSEYMSITKNAYVGGDAYNFIINGTYFTGYSVIASSMFLSGVVLMSSAEIVNVKIKEYE